MVVVVCTFFESLDDWHASLVGLDNFKLHIDDVIVMVLSDDVALDIEDLLVLVFDDVAGRVSFGVLLSIVSLAQIKECFLWILHLVSMVI